MKVESENRAVPRFVQKTAHSIRTFSQSSYSAHANWSGWGVTHGTRVGSGVADSRT